MGLPARSVSRELNWTNNEFAKIIFFSPVGHVRVTLCEIGFKKKKRKKKHLENADTSTYVTFDLVV